MFDDDTSYLEQCASEIKKYGLPVYYPYEHCLMSVLKEPSEHTIVVIRKKKNIPFYQGFGLQIEPTQEDYLRIVQDNKLVEFVFTNRDKVRNFLCADVSGHENFIGNFLKVLKDNLK